MTEQKLREILEQKVEVPVMVDNKLKNTYAQLEGRERPAKRKGLRAARVALIAAVLAVAGVLCVAAGVPARVFNLAVGGTASYQGSMGTLRIDGDIERLSPLTEEDGRLWLTVRDEQRIDVTDLIDENTPYIYDNTDPETGYRDYLVVGGTLEDYGWYECFEIEKDRFGACASNRHNIYCTIDGVRYDFGELTEEQRERIDPGSFEEVYKPWYEAAAQQLKLTELNIDD